MKLLLLLSCLFYVSSVSAQVTVVKDPRVDLLVNKQAELNKKAYSDNNKTSLGFRVVVINTNNRQAAVDVKSRLMREYPEHKTYMLYQAPNFKVQIGNFRTRKEADALKNQLSKTYSSGLLVIATMVELKPEEEPIQ